MNDPCPCCGLLFQREQGYFLGAMYMSYPLSAAILLAFFFLLSALLPNWNTIWVALLAVVPYVPFAPAVFRYSRVLWIYFDRWADPYGNLALENRRLREIAAAENKSGGNRPSGA
jgi:hypothetical protein